MVRRLTSRGHSRRLGQPRPLVPYTFSNSTPSSSPFVLHCYLSTIDSFTQVAIATGVRRAGGEGQRSSLTTVAPFSFAVIVQLSVCSAAAMVVGEHRGRLCGQRALRSERLGEGFCCSLRYVFEVANLRHRACTRLTCSSRCLPLHP